MSRDMSKASSYKNTESLAFWDKPKDMQYFATLSDKEKDLAFKDVFQPREFNLDKIKDRNMDHVVVGMNPGKEGDKIPAGTLRAFHWGTQSNDYRLASALVDTEYWGSFMTDLSVQVESKSEKVTLNNQHVDALLDEFKDVGVSPNAKVLLLGGKTYDAIKKYKGNEEKGYSASKEFEKDRVCKINGYTFKKIYHYSPSNNGHWNRTKVINQIIN